LPLSFSIIRREIKPPNALGFDQLRNRHSAVVLIYVWPSIN
jgi:hypothetical protein